MQSLNKLRQCRNGVSNVNRYLALVLSFAAVMFPMTLIGNVHAQEQSPASQKKSDKLQAQDAAKEEQSDKVIAFPDAQTDQGIDSQKDGGKDVKPSVPWPLGGGDASFSNGIYDCAGGPSYTYRVQSGPPNVCGELRIVRNGVLEVTGGWICTDSSGNATKGPWNVVKDQTGTNIFIRWPDGTSTSGGDYKVDDFSKPVAFINSGYPGSFSGYATDAQWGSGFGSWTTVKMTFLNDTTGKYWNGSSYGSFSPVYFVASTSGSGTYITWWMNNPPPVASGNRYIWCVEANDRCSYSTKKCVTFNY